MLHGYKICTQSACNEKQCRTHIWSDDHIGNSQTAIAQSRDCRWWYEKYNCRHVVYMWTQCKRWLNHARRRQSKSYAQSFHHHSELHIRIIPAISLLTRVLKLVFHWTWFMRIAQYYVHATQICICNRPDRSYSYKCHKYASWLKPIGECRSTRFGESKW